MCEAYGAAICTITEMGIRDTIAYHPPPFLGEFIKDNDHILEAISNYIGHDTRKVTPHKDMIFSGLQLVSFDTYGLFSNSLKVVVMLQDPYVQEGAAMGTAMATTNGKIQGTLHNFYRRASETYTSKDPGGHPHTCEADGTLKPIITGDIRGLSAQGVLLMNASMTTVVGTPKAHTDAWSLFTGKLVKYLSDEFPFLVFILLGRDAQAYKGQIAGRHATLCTSHPSGRGYTYGFHECDIFNEANDHLNDHMMTPIQWEDYLYYDPGI